MTMTLQQDRPSSSSSPVSSSSLTHVFKGSSPISKYEMLEKLGEGTFGYHNRKLRISWLILISEVWKARHVGSKELFALKKILMHNEKEGVRILMFT